MQFETRALAGTPAGSEIARGERASLERSHQSARALPSHSSGFSRACVFMEAVPTASARRSPRKAPVDP